MKKLNLFFTAVLIISSLSINAQVAISTDGSAPDGSAMLDVQSNDKGFLPPRMTRAQMDAIVTPAEGLMVYCTDCTVKAPYFFDGTSWISTIDGTIVLFVPGAPTIGTAVAGPGEASVSFTAPASDGGATITSYTATSDPGGFTGTLTQAGSGTITVTGLSNGTAYTFTVTATNSVGTSLPSAASNSVTPVTVPDAPTIGIAVAGNKEASVSFTAPAFDGGTTITSYTATSSPGGFTGTLTQAGSGTITVTGLTNYITYTFTVTATNSVGTGTASAASNSVTPSPVVGPTDVLSSTGKVWMDRNLGASQVATSSTDAAAYGYAYQWGRLSDGHESRTSSTTTTLSSTDDPGHSNFIVGPGSPYDWRSPQNSNLWQGESGTSNPCPSGYRLPTGAEWTEESATWSSQNATGAFASALKLPAAGFRTHTNGAFSDVGTYGRYWGSNTSGTESIRMGFGTLSVTTEYVSRAFGFSVRCIKD